MPLLTVIMPVYNAGNRLAASIGSTLRAMPRDAQLAIWEDGSTDDTAGVLNRWRDDSRVRVFGSGSNVGVARGLNELLAQTDSRFVARMDSDDVCLPWRFHRSMAELHRAELDMVFTQVVHANASMRKMRPSAPLAISTKAFPLTLLVRNPVAHSTLVARREAISNLNGYRELPSEDYDLWMRAALAGKKAARLATPGLIYRHHAEQVTSDAKWQTSAQTNAETAAVHRELLESLLGERLEVFSELRSGSTHSVQLGRFLSSLDRAAGTLPRHLDRLVIRREIAARRARHA